MNELRINAFRGTTAERIVLNEGLTSIGERVFRDADNLKNVVIPSTVTKIEKQAFQLCGLTELTIPATVTTIEDGAFRDMPNLTTLTIEGNPTIANYAGRSCKNLETVILTGDDVTFTGTSQVFTHADTGNAAGITIHVANKTVESRLQVAQGSARNYEIVVGTNG